RNRPVGEDIAVPGAIRVSAGGEWIIDLVARSTEIEIAAQHIEGWSLLGHDGRLLLVLFLPAEEEERLVASVVDLRDENGTAGGGVGVLEERAYAVGSAWLRVGGFETIEEEPVLHTAHPS